MLANTLPLHTPLAPGLESKCHFFYSESSHVANQINGNEAEITMQANILPFYKHSTPGWDQEVKTIFLKAMLNIILKVKKC